MINGNTFRDMIISAANNIENHKNEINSLNVFPVPDGDTGTNMSLTMSSAANALSKIDNKGIGEVADMVASSLLKGARGNSGVILSLLFRGISRGLSGLESAGSEDFSRAFEYGVTTAYKAVMKPTEGTILTVARVASEKTKAFVSESVTARDAIDYYVKKANETLDQTPEMLPVLKQAGVVDAGGKGLVTILEGALSYLDTGVIIEAKESTQSAPVEDFSQFNNFESEDEIKFAYCTEYIINKDSNSKHKDVSKLREYLESIGDCVVAVEDDDIVKVHVHTNHPGRAIEEALRYGPLVNMKIDNMRDQFKNKKESVSDKPAAMAKDYGFVAVAAGSGVCAVFKDLGADVVVEGGQTMNPSTDDILKAVNSTPAKTVFILPNNKNIIMAAEQTIGMSDREIIVIKTKTIPQGISAMVAFDESVSAQENAEAMNDTISLVHTAQVTYAARDSMFDGKEIKEGQLLGLVEGKVSFVEDSMERLVKEIFEQLLEFGGDYINIYYGEGVSEDQAQQVYNIVKDMAGDAEVVMLEGGQPVYHYIFSVE